MIEQDESSEIRLTAMEGEANAVSSARIWKQERRGESICYIQF